MQIAAMVILSALIGGLCGACVVVWTDMYMNHNKRR